MSDDLSLPPAPAPDPIAGVAVRLAAVAERQKSQGATLARVEEEVTTIDKRLRRLEWIGVALAASGLLGRGLAGSLITGLFGGG